MGIAGQIDLLMADDSAKQGIIIDWKTNSKITDEEGAFGTMLEPIKHLKNCDTVKYGLQLGLYEKMLIDEKYYPEFKGYRKALVHVRESFGKVVKVDDYNEEIERMLKWQSE
jgi:ATP-dependent exoDNAse (exonuclease V) beta subunit